MTDSGTGKLFEAGVDGTLAVVRKNTYGNTCWFVLHLMGSEDQNIIPLNDKCARPASLMRAIRQCTTGKRAEAVFSTHFGYRGHIRNLGGGICEIALDSFRGSARHMRVKLITLDLASLPDVIMDNWQPKNAA